MQHTAQVAKVQHIVLAEVGDTQSIPLLHRALPALEQKHHNRPVYSKLR
jgi:hypothetical protein